MKVQALVLVASIAVLAGCSQVEQKAAEVQQNAETAVNQKLQEAEDAAKREAAKVADIATKDMMNRLDPDGTLRQTGKRFQEAPAMVAKVKEGNALDPEVKGWITAVLQDSNQAVRAAAIPVMTAVHEKTPQARDWVTGQAQEAAKTAEPKFKAAWQDILDAWSRMESITNAQR